MEEIYTPDYRDEGPFFLSNFGQITRCVRIHGTHNEEAIDRNTEAIIEQTEMQHAESDESQVQFSGHSMMLERESNETQALFKAESDETQNVLTAHTKAMKDEASTTRSTLSEQGTAIKNAITAQTGAITEQGTGIKDAISAQTSDLKTELENIANMLDAIEGKMDANAAQTIADAIGRLDLVVNNYITP